MNNKIFLLAIALLASFGAFSQDKKNDTLKFKWNRSRIWIFEDPNAPRRDSVKSTDKKNFVHWGGIDLGICFLTTIDNKLRLSDEADTTHMNYFLDLNYGKSWFFSLNLFEKSFRMYKNYVLLATGLGIEWTNYNFNKNITFDPDASYISASTVTVAPDSVTYLKNKLKAAYLKAPLFIELNSNAKNPDKSFHIAAGMELAYKLSSKTKQKYDVNGNEFVIKQKDDYHLANFKYHSTLRIGYGNYFTVFMNYGLSELFEADKGPQVFPFTAGVSVNF